MSQGPFRIIGKDAIERIRLYISFGRAMKVSANYDHIYLQQTMFEED